MLKEDKNMTTVIRLPNNSLLEELYHLCLKCKFAWFCTDYYGKRNTIEKYDISNIYFTILDLGLDMSKELHQWFKTNLNLNYL